MVLEPRFPIRLLKFLNQLAKHLVVIQSSLKLQFIYSWAHKLDELHESLCSFDEINCHANFCMFPIPTRVPGYCLLYHHFSSQRMFPQHTCFTALSQSTKDNSTFIQGTHTPVQDTFCTLKAFCWGLKALTPYIFVSTGNFMLFVPSLPPPKNVKI